MIRNMISLFVWFGVTLFGASVAHSSSYDFEITEYNVDLNVKKNGKLEVHEYITVYFHKKRRGIYRFIPLQRPDGRNIRLSNFIVMDGKKRPLKKLSTVDITRNFNEVNIRVGKVDKWLIGVHHYKISYVVSHAVAFHKQEEDELYWNAIGTKWNVPIHEAKVTFRLPKGLFLESVRKLFFVGGFRSKRNSNVKVVQRADRIEWTRTKSLSPRQGITVVLGWPSGVIKRPGLVDIVLEKVLEYGLVFCFLLFPLGVIWFTLFRNRRARRRAQKNIRSAVPTWPTDLTAMEVGTLIDGSFDPEDLMAGLVQLAVRGYIVIDDRDAGIYLLRGKKYYQKKRKDLTPSERELMKSLTPINKSGLRLSKLKHTFEDRYDKISERISDDLVSKGLFKKKKSKKQPGTFLFMLWYAGFMLSIISFAFSSGQMSMVPIILGSSIFLFFSGIMLSWNVSEKMEDWFYEEIFSGLAFLLVALALVTFFSVFFVPIPILISAWVSCFFLFVSIYIYSAVPHFSWLTNDGLKVLGQLLHLQEYLNGREPNELFSIDTREKFDSNLPYAIALGQSASFIEFSSSQVWKPSKSLSLGYYRYQRSMQDSELIYLDDFIGCLDEFSTKVKTDITTPPRVSSSSGYSGSSGFSSGSSGGFSGGGGGGGGGGSW